MSPGLTNYADYVALFNKGNDRALCETFFAEDCEFLSGPGEGHEIHGRENLIKFLEFMHEGVREIDRPQLVLHQGNTIFAEIDMDFHSSVAKSTALGEMKPGITLTVKFFALYILNSDNLIKTLKLMMWPEGYRVSKEPRLGGSNGQKAAFLSYISAVNAGAYDTFAKFYHPDVVLNLPNVGDIKGQDGIKGFYKTLFEKVKEHLDVKRLIADDDGICAEFQTTFTAVQDHPEFSVKPLKKGDVVVSNTVVMYELKEGLIYRIQVSRK